MHCVRHTNTSYYQSKSDCIWEITTHWNVKLSLTFKVLTQEVSNLYIDKRISIVNLSFSLETVCFKSETLAYEKSLSTF
jgi:hypothetical protein